MIEISIMIADERWHHLNDYSNSEHGGVYMMQITNVYHRDDSNVYCIVKREYIPEYLREIRYNKIPFIFNKNNSPPLRANVPLGPMSLVTVDKLQMPRHLYDWALMLLRIAPIRMF